MKYALQSPYTKFSAVPRNTAVSILRFGGKKTGTQQVVSPPVYACPILLRIV